MRAWRKIGPIGRLHNIVTFIRGSPQRIQAFLHGQASDDARELAVNVISDNKTRWNSTYYMIARALRLQPHLDNYVSHQIETRQGLADDVLNGEDWVFLRKLHQLLQLFEKATKECQGHAQSGSGGCIWEVLPTLDSLKSHLEEAYRKADATAAACNSSRALCTSIDNGIDCLDRYYDKLAETAVYPAAVILNPRMKEHYVLSSHHDDTDLQQRFKKAVRNLWEMQYKPTPVLETSQSSQNSAFASQGPGDPELSIVDAWLAKMETQPTEQLTLDDTPLFGRTRQGDGQRRTTIASSNSASPSDQLDRWLQEPLENTRSPIAYWLSKRDTYPDLARMALDILSIPATSTEAERVFSRFAGYSEA
jgi:hypothetical protein